MWLCISPQNRCDLPKKKMKVECTFSKLPLCVKREKHNNIFEYDVFIWISATQIQIWLVQIQLMYTYLNIGLTLYSNMKWLIWIHCPKIRHIHEYIGISQIFYLNFLFYNLSHYFLSSHFTFFFFISTKNPHFPFSFISFFFPFLFILFPHIFIFLRTQDKSKVDPSIRLDKAICFNPLSSSTWKKKSINLFFKNCNTHNNLF